MALTMKPDRSRPRSANSARGQTNTQPAQRLRTAFAAVRVSFTWLGVRKSLSAEQKSQAAESFGAEGQYLSAAKKLLDTKHPAFAAVTSLRSQIVSYWKNLSLPYPEPGIRLIKQDQIESFNQQLTLYRQQLEDAVGNLDQHFESLKTTASEQLGSLYNPADYPVSLVGLFAVEWDFPSVEPPEYLLRLNPELYQQETARISARFDQAVQLAEEAFVGELSKLVGHLTERLTEGVNGEKKVFRDSAMTNLNEFFTRFKTLNVGSNAELERLTHGPGIFVVNDGPFTEEDEQAIRRFGLGNKPDNPNKIGQFGLGLKSVFHLCEAYIYASQSSFPPMNGNPRREFQAFDICNPWSGIAGHPSKGSWDSLPASVGQKIRRYLANVVPGNISEARPAGWLCLWLPLRRKLWEEPDKNWYFPGEFHGDQRKPPHEIFSHLEHSVAAMLPMMRHLRRVRVWMPDAEHLPTAVTSVALVDGGRCVYRYDAPADAAPRQMSGQIDEARDGKSLSLLYAGVQQKLGDTELARLRSDAAHWPRIEGFHDKTGFCVVRAKNDQHAAAYFTRRTTSSPGTLRITWAVFLPLSAEQSAPYPLECKDEVTLTLHGWFFVDPGRHWADVFHRSTTESSTIEEQWNRRLAEQGTLRLLIPALEQLVQKCSVNDPLPLSITSAIQSSELFKSYSLAICSDQSWGRFVYPAEARWHALNSLAEFVEIPSPPKDHSTGFAFRVFPALGHLVSQGISVVLRGAPRLMAALPSVWKTSWIADLLHSVPLPLAVTDANYLEYLVEFLADTAGALLISDPSVSAELSRIGRVAIGNLSKRPSSLLDVAIQKLLALIAGDTRLRISHSDELVGESRRIARTLQASSRRMVLVPAPFDSVQNPCQGKLGPEEAIGQLEVLVGIVPASQQAEIFAALRSLVALDLIRAVAADGEGLRTLVTAISHFNLFPVTTFRTNTRSATSMDRLFKALEEKLLFFQIPAWLKELQRCLHDDEVLYLQQKEVAELMEQVKHRVPFGSACRSLNSPAIDVRIVPLSGFQSRGSTD